jgi:hypothetical protein
VTAVVVLFCRVVLSKVPWDLHHPVAKRPLQWSAWRSGCVALRE